MVEVLVTYMELVAAPQPISMGQPDGVAIARERPSVDDYLSLYRAVGEPVQWDQRLRMPIDDLSALLAAPSTFVFVLRVNGRPVGLCEFEGVGGPSVELAHFGLVPEAQGRGLGRLLLNRALSDVWTHSPRRIWLHTDTNDHPRAVATYERVGFRIYDRRTETFPD